MTWKRTLALIVSVIWIAICAVSVFAQTPVVNVANVSSSIASNNALCVDVQHLAATTFDDMHLEDLLNIEVRSDVAILASTMPSLIAPNGDFMEQIVVPQTFSALSVQCNSESNKIQVKSLTNSILFKNLRSANTNSRANPNPTLLGYRKSRASPAATK